MNFRGVTTQLRTTDLAGSIRFDTETVGLALEFRFQDFYAGIRAGSQLFHLKLVDERDPTIDYVDREDHFHLYLQVDDADAAEAALTAKGVRLVRAACDTAWGTRELVVKDDQGHTLIIGQRLDTAEGA